MGWVNGTTITTLTSTKQPAATSVTGANGIATPQPAQVCTSPADPTHYRFESQTNLSSSLVWLFSATLLPKYQLVTHVNRLQFKRASQHPAFSCGIPASATPAKHSGPDTTSASVWLVLNQKQVPQPRQKLHQLLVRLRPASSALVVNI